MSLTDEPASEVRAQCASQGLPRNPGNNAGLYNTEVDSWRAPGIGTIVERHIEQRTLGAFITDS
jgi:hypothetical protein